MKPRVQRFYDFSGSRTLTTSRSPPSQSQPRSVSFATGPRVLAVVELADRAGRERHEGLGDVAPGTLAPRSISGSQSEDRAIVGTRLPAE